MGCMGGEIRVHRPLHVFGAGTCCMGCSVRVLAGTSGAHAKGCRAAGSGIQGSCGRWEGQTEGQETCMLPVNCTGVHLSQMARMLHGLHACMQAMQHAACRWEGQRARDVHAARESHWRAPEPDGAHAAWPARVHAGHAACCVQVGGTDRGQETCMLPVNRTGVHLSQMARASSSAGIPFLASPWK